MLLFQQKSSLFSRITGRCLTGRTHFCLCSAWGLYYLPAIFPNAREVSMCETRRFFVRSLTAAAGLLAASPVLIAQRSIKPPPQPEPAEKSAPDARSEEHTSE